MPWASQLKASFENPAAPGLSVSIPSGKAFTGWRTHALSASSKCPNMGKFSTDDKCFGDWRGLRSQVCQKHACQQPIDTATAEGRAAVDFLHQQDPEIIVQKKFTTTTHNRGGLDSTKDGNFSSAEAVIGGATLVSAIGGVCPEFERGNGCSTAHDSCHSYTTEGKCVENDVKITKVCHRCVKQTRMVPLVPDNNPADPWGKSLCHSSCKTCLQGNREPTACTSCPAPTPRFKFIGNKHNYEECKGGLPCHLTIMFPREHAGTCNKEYCHHCKTRACCQNKHFIVDPDAMQGVCVPHTDDCTPLCVVSKKNPGKKVCSKGCNTLVRSAEVAEQGKSALSVCQVDKLTVCDTSAPKKSVETPSIDARIQLHHQEVTSPQSALCSGHTQKQATCKVACTGLDESQMVLMNQAGPTCLVKMHDNHKCFTNQLVSKTDAQSESSLDVSMCGAVVSQCPPMQPKMSGAIVKIVQNHCSATLCRTSQCEVAVLGF